MKSCPRFKSGRYPVFVPLSIVEGGFTCIASDQPPTSGSTVRRGKGFGFTTYTNHAGTSGLQSCCLPRSRMVMSLFLSTSRLFHEQVRALTDALRFA